MDSNSRGKVEQEFGSVGVKCWVMLYNQGQHYIREVHTQGHLFRFITSDTLTLRLKHAY